MSKRQPNSTSKGGNRLTDRFVPIVNGGTEPVLLRGRYVRTLGERINANTVALAPPRMVNDSRVQDTLILADTTNQTQQVTDVPDSADGPSLGEKIVLEEIRRSTSTVRVENPDDSEQYVDVERIDAVLMLASDGTVYELRFYNT